DTSSLSPGVVGTDYRQQLTASGGVGPYSWILIGGSLPPGINFSPTGLLSGTPSTAGTFGFVVRVGDQGSPPQTVTQAFGLVFTNPLGITNPATLNNGSMGVPYSIAMLGSGGTPPYSWSVPTGQLPPRLTLSSAGILSGTPTSMGTFNFT